MKLIKPEVWEYHQDPTIDAMYKAIRDAAATCYQTDVEKMKLSPQEFVEKVLLKNGHTRPLEFGTVYLLRSWHTYPSMDPGKYVDNMSEMNEWKAKYEKNPYSRVQMYDQKSHGGDIYHFVAVTTNFRVIMQGDYSSDYLAHQFGYNKNWKDDLIFKDDLTYWPSLETFYNYQFLFYNRRTFVMNMSRGCTDDCRTHITLSSMCESTRFCNYKNGKFGGQLTFIEPYWFGQSKWRDFWFKVSCKIDEFIYIQNARLFKYQPQQLKRLFPLGCKAELRLCGFDDAWSNFFWRRSDDHADPECKIISDQIKQMYYGD